MTYDWLSASPDARVELYRSCKRVVDGHFLGSWDRFYKLALGDNASFGVGYEDNFRKGRIARSKAAMLARWLSIHHTRESEQLALRLRALTNAPRSDWNQFVDDLEHDGGLSIVRLSDFGIVSFAKSAANNLPRVRIGEEFCLRLNSAFDGRAIGFQLVRGHASRSGLILLVFDELIMHL